MENIIVGLVVAAALIFSLRSFVRIYKGDGACGCGCACSPLDKACCKKKISRVIPPKT